MSPPRRPDDLTEDDEVVIRGLVDRFTARQLAEELTRRCACAFDHRLPGDALPHHECEYHRQRRQPLTADELDDLLDLLDRMVEGEPRNPDVMAWIPLIGKLRAMREDLKGRST